MYPDFSYIFHDLFGAAPDNWTSIFKTFGLLLVLAILASSRFLFIELKRKAAEGIFQPTPVKRVSNQLPGWGDYLSNALMGFFIGFKGVYAIGHFSELQADASGVLLSAKGEWWAGILGALALAGYRYWEARKLAGQPQVTETVNLYPHDRIGDITLIAALSGVVGAKIFSILEDPPATMIELWKSLFSGSGLTIYGGLIGGFFGVWWYLRRHKIPFIHVLDAVAPALIVGYGVGRLGCHFAGDGDWGIVAAAQPSWWFLPDWLWAYDYPHNIINEGPLLANCAFEYCHYLAEPVYPTPLYESFFAFTIAGILWSLRKRLKVPGMLFFAYLVLNGFERFWIEKIRVNIPYHIGGWEATQAEIIAVLLFVIGITGLVVLWRRGEGAKVGQ
ncbi:MAG: prolipoprotein diacylglyceryl transferase [Saprospiraceae bacterium]|nr:prolipoprotein diacylglyceryl transferase [Saprospiraceae bacterium]